VSLDLYHQISPKNIEITSYSGKINFIEKLFNLYDPSIISLNFILILIQSIQDFKSLKLLSNTAKSVNILFKDFIEEDDV